MKRARQEFLAPLRRRDRYRRLLLEQQEGRRVLTLPALSIGLSMRECTLRISRVPLGFGPFSTILSWARVPMRKC